MKWTQEMWRVLTVELWFVLMHFRPRPESISFLQGRLILSGSFDHIVEQVLVRGGGLFLQMKMFLFVLVVILTLIFFVVVLSLLLNAQILELLDCDSLACLLEATPDRWGLGMAMRQFLAMRYHGDMKRLMFS